MGVYYETIPDSLRQWILDQKMLWVGTAPLSSDGHINISPKGGQYFGIVNATTFWFMDLTGSGVETTAHLHEPGNGRICVMFVAFEGPPRIVRLWGKARAIENGTDEFDDFASANEVKLIPGARSFIVLDIDQVGTSCGFSVPFYDFRGFRSTLNDIFKNKERKFNEGKSEESMEKYWAFKSQLSVDGLPGLKRGFAYAQQHRVTPLKKFVGHATPKAPRTLNTVSQVHIFIVALLSLVLGAVMTLTMVSPEVVRKIQQKEYFL